MKGFSTSAAASVVLGATLAKAITSVTVKGNAFFAGNERFYIRGVDYQPGGSAGAETVSGAADPIANAEDCKRDLANFKKLGVNTIRVYTVDNAADHKECMDALSAAGIYVALDVNTPQYSLNRADPYTSYNDKYLQSIFATIDEFQQYDNTLLFFSANEVINNAKNSDTAPYIKAVIRDMKQYISAQNYRSIPVGYSAADVAESREQTAEYLNCGSDAVRSDFFAFNDYSWCDPSSFTESGWDQKVETYKTYSIPLFLSEYGCIDTPRHFEEVATLYSDQMTSVYSGGLVYEYSEEGTGYGLVTISGSGSVTPGSDFTDLMNAFKKTPSPSGDGGYHTDGTPSKCPAPSSDWEVKNNSLPIIPEPATKFMTDGAGKAPGLNGPGSQTAGTPSPGFADAGEDGSAPNVPSAGDDSGDGGSAATNLNIPQMGFVVPAIMGLVMLATSSFGGSLL